MSKLLSLMLSSALLFSAGNFYGKNNSAFAQGKKSGFLESVKKEKSFLKSIKEEYTDIVYVKGNSYEITENQKDKKIKISPEVADDYTKKSIIFTYLVKKDMGKIFESSEKAAGSVRKAIDFLTKESWEFYATGKNQKYLLEKGFFGDDPLMDYANMPSSYESRLFKREMDESHKFFRSLSNKNPSWEKVLNNFMDWGIASDEHAREKTINKINKKQLLQELSAKRKETLRFEFNSSLETMADEISDILLAEEINPNIFLGHTTLPWNLLKDNIKGRKQHYIGFISPKIPFVLDMITKLFYLDKVLDGKKINIEDFSLDDAKSIYFDKKLENFFGNFYGSAVMFDKNLNSIQNPNWKSHYYNWICRSPKHFRVLINDKSFEKFWKKNKNNLKKGLKAEYMSGMISRAVNLNELKDIIPFIFLYEIPSVASQFFEGKATHVYQSYNYAWWYNTLCDLYQKDYEEIIDKTMKKGKENINVLNKSEEDLEKIINSYQIN